MFAVTLPTALPTAISTLPCAPAITDTNSSGSVVATLTIVAPIISFGMPLTSAIQEAASTKKSPPFTIKTIPKIKSNLKYIRLFRHHSMFDANKEEYFTTMIESAVEFIDKLNCESDLKIEKKKT